MLYLLSQEAATDAGIIRCLRGGDAASGCGDRALDHVDDAISGFEIGLDEV